MSETSIRVFRRETILNLSKSLIGNYIGEKQGDGKLGFSSLDYKTEDGDTESIRIRKIFARDFIRIQNLFSILDDLVLYDLSKYGEKSSLKGFWYRFTDEVFEQSKKRNAAALDIRDIVKNNFIQCDQAIRKIYCILGANDYLFEKEQKSEQGGKKYTFGSLLYDDGIDALINNGKGRYNLNNEEVKTLISLLLRERNKYVHEKTADNPTISDSFISDVNTNESENQNRDLDKLVDECREKTAIVLVALLHITDYHYDALDQYFNDYFAKEENQHILRVEAITETSSTNPEVLKKDYVQSLLVASNEQLKRNVGHVGNIANDEELRLMNLKMQLIWKDKAPIVDDSESESKQEDDFSQNIKSIELKQITSKRDDENRVNIILGNPGSGKSTLLAQLQKNLCKRWLEGEIDAPFPVSLAFKSVDKANFVDSVREKVSERLFPYVERLCKEGKVVFILDGLNELPLKNPENYLESLRNSIISEYKGCHFYITGRNHEFEDVSGKFQSLEECSIYRMREISMDDITRYFKELNASEESTNTFLAWIQNAQIANLLASPLNFSMISRMVLSQEDYSVPVESINNRGELLDLFLKSTLQDKGVLTSGIEGETFKILQLLAVALDRLNNRPISLGAFFSSYCKDLYPDGNSVEREIIIRGYLNDSCRLNVLNRSFDVNGAELYSFAIDTFQEFFHARSFAVDFVGNPAQALSGKRLSECLIDGFDVHEKRRFEMLKLALELIVGGRIQKETSEQDGIRFVEDFLNLYSDSLGTLAELSSALPSSAEARFIVEQEVLEQMVSYREKNVMPSPEDDKSELLSITKSAVMLSSDAIFKELFNYYWMSATGMVAYWEFGFSFSFPASTIIQFRTNLVSNCTDPNKFYDFLHQATLDLLPLYNASISFLNLTRNLLFSELTTYRQKILYLHICECYKTSISLEHYARPDHILSQDASLLLMYIDDPDYIYEKLDFDEMRKNGTKIGTHTLLKLLQNYRHRSTHKIVFQDEFYDLLKVDGKTEEEREAEKKFKIATIIRYFLFRNCIPQELLDYILPNKGNGLERLHEHERLPILDLLPISELRAFQERYYDPDIFQYLDENDDEEESIEGLHYRIYKRQKDSTLVWIRNITTSFKGLTAVVGSNRAQIIEDEHLISKQYRFKITSSTIIEASGMMCVSGQTIMYDAPFAGPEVIFTTFDEQIAELLNKESTVSLGNSQVCTIEKIYEGQPKAWRVLTLGGNADIPYFGDMQFAEGDNNVNIDKTIRQDSYRYEPQLFRKLENLQTQNCSSTPFHLLGLSNTRVWVVTDKLMNYDRYYEQPGKKSAAYVRAKGNSVLCRFLEAHPFSNGFVELTLRSSVPFDYQEQGILHFTLENHEEDSVPYVYCHSVGTRVVVRILDKDFVKSISVHEKRISYMAGVFRIGKLSLVLDYVDIFPASDRLSVWTLQRLSNQSFPHDGFLEVGEDVDFSKLYKLSFTKETRRAQIQFKECRCLQYDIEKNIALFAVDNHEEPIAPGLFLTNDDSAVHLRIVESNTCRWVAESSFTPEMQIPRSGYLELTHNGEKIPYSIIVTEGSKNTAEFYGCSDSCDFVSFERDWDSTELFVFVSYKGETVKTGFRKKASLSRVVEKQILKTDTLLDFNPNTSKYGNWYLSVFCPIRNEIDRGYDTVDKIIKVHSVPYTKYSDKAIIIRKPVTEFENLFIRCDDSTRLAKVKNAVVDKNNPYNINPYGFEYCTVELEGKGGRILDIRPNGEIRFYTKQLNEYVGVPVGYRRVLEVIDLKKQRDLKKREEITDSDTGKEYNYYPAQICDTLIKELSDIDMINEDLVKFFANHSRAYMLFAENKLLSKIQALQCETPLINLCTVRSIDKEGQINTFSWLNNKAFPSMDSVDNQVHVGDLVFVERNHKITPASYKLVQGSVFPNIGELPKIDEGNHDYDVSPNTWQQEEERVRKFKDDVSSLIAFLQQKGSSKYLTVKLPEAGFTNDKGGIIVLCQEIPDFQFRLVGVSETSHDTLIKGNAICVLPSQRVKETFNPYKFTPNFFVSVIDSAELEPRRNANYYCVVNNHIVRKSRNDNLVGVSYGDIIGAFTKTSTAHYDNGAIVHLQLLSVAKKHGGTRYAFSTSLSSGIRVGQLNLNVGDVLDDIVVTNNGINNSFIEVEYRIQGCIIKGSVDNNIPAFSSRMLCGLYSPGTKLSLRVKAIRPDQNSIQFELANRRVQYPFGPGVYNCVLHTNPRSVFTWRQIVAWATFQVNGIEYTIEVPIDEMLDAHIGKDDRNVYFNFIKCGQGIPAQLEISGFDEFGDPIIKLQSHNRKVINELPIGSTFEARIMCVNTQVQLALWISADKSGLARFRIRPKVGSITRIHLEEKDGNKAFIVYNEDISRDTLPLNSELCAKFEWDERYLDKNLFIANEFNSESLQPTGRRFLCRHTTGTLVWYWIEYLIAQNKPLKAYIERIEDDIHYVTFEPSIEYNLDDFRFEQDLEYSVSVVCVTKSHIIVKYIREDGKPIIGAIEHERIDDFFRWAPDFDAFKPGQTLGVHLVLHRKNMHAVYFSPAAKIESRFPYGLTDGEIVPCRVYHIDSRGNTYVKPQCKYECRALITPFFTDWSILPSGKSIARIDELRRYQVTLKKNYFQLSGRSEAIKKNPWNENHLTSGMVYPVVITRVDSEDILVEFNGLYGEIPTIEFQKSLEELRGQVGETINARLSIIDLSAFTLVFTIIGVEELIEKTPEPTKFNEGDVITASVNGYIDEQTPIIKWEGQELQITPAHAAFLAEKPWLESVNVETELPIGSTYKFVISQINDDGSIKTIKPYNRCSEDFKKNKEADAIVLQSTEEGVYAKIVEEGEAPCFVFVPKEEITYGRVYTAQGYFDENEKITVVHRAKCIKPLLINCSIKRNYTNPRLAFEAGATVAVKVEKILPTALNVICNNLLRLQIAVEDTTWNPAYLLGQQANLSQRFAIGQELKATVEEGGMNESIRLSLRDRINPWEFGQIAVGQEWPASVVKILDSDHFVVNCRGLFIRVSNKLGLEVKNQTWVRIRIREVIPDEPYASAVLLELLLDKGEVYTLVEAEQIPFNIGERIQVRITRIHHHLMAGDVDDFLECEPVGFSLIPVKVPNFELAWNSEARKVDQYRVGDELDVIVTGIEFNIDSKKKRMLMTASIREARQNAQDTRSIDEIIRDNIYDESDTNKQKEEITVQVSGISLQAIKDTKQVLHHVDFTYAGYSGRITLNNYCWSAIQCPDSFFKKGRKLRVRVTGKGDFYDKSFHQKKDFIKATIPFINDIHWENIEKKQGLIGDAATILFIDENELFVRYAGSFVVKMNRDALLWEPTLPLNQRFKVGQIIPVFVKTASAKKRIIELDHRCTKDNPYNENLEINVGDICNGRVIAEDKDRYYLDIDIKDNNRVTCVLPFSEFPYRWHRKYEKGSFVRVVIIDRDVHNCRLIASIKDERLASSEKEFVVDKYYWFKVFDFQKSSIVLDNDGYRAYLKWEDAWLENISDPTDMYPEGLNCLLCVKSIDASGKIYVTANYNWDIGLNNIRLKSKFQAEVCLRNPANGIIMRVIGSEDQFCFVTRKNFSEPLFSDIVSYRPKDKKTLFAQYGKDKVYAVFDKSSLVKPKEEDYYDVRPGMVVTGKVKRISDKYVIVEYNNILISVDQDYIESKVKRDDVLTVRITHHEYYTDTRGEFVSKKLLGSASGVNNNPFSEMSVGKQVIGRIAKVPTNKGKGEIVELRVDLPNKGTVIGKLLNIWGKTDLYRGQRVIAYVTSHNYETHELQFTLYRPNSNKLFVGSIVKANIIKISDETGRVTVDASFGNNHYNLDVPLDSFFWGKKPSTPFIKVGERYNMAVIGLNRGDFSPTALNRKSLYLDYSKMVGEIVRGRVVAHEQDGCVIMAGATVGFMPVSEMSYQRCDLWQMLFPVGASCDFMVCEEDINYPGTTIFSYRMTYENPFGLFNLKELTRNPAFNGEIVRANESKAVVRVLSKIAVSKNAYIEAQIPNMKVFSDGFQTIVPQVGTIVPLKLTRVEVGEDGKLEFEVVVVPNSSSR